MKTVNQKTETMKRVMIILLVLLTVPVVQALAGPRGFSSDPGAPIDGGISLLVAAGVGYGVKKARDARNKNKDTAGNKAQAEV